MTWRDLTAPQQKVLARLKRSPASAEEIGCNVTTFYALSRRKLIHVATTFDNIAFPRRAVAEITDAGRAALNQ